MIELPKMPNYAASESIAGSISMEAGWKEGQKGTLRWFVEELEVIMTEARLGSRLDEIEKFIKELRRLLEG